MSESDYLTSLKARWLILHNDVLCRLNVAENFVATIASQKLPSELPPGTAPSDEGVVEKVRKILEEIETETNRATREFHGNSYSAAFAHNRARAALAAINGEK